MPSKLIKKYQNPSTPITLNEVIVEGKYPNWFQRNILIPIKKFIKEEKETNPIFGQRRIKNMLNNPNALDNWKMEELIKDEIVSPTINTYNSMAINTGFPLFYPTYNYSFSDAYKDARSKGLNTFIYGLGYYNTDYSGAHHKLYELDLNSGKVANWYLLYPNFTYPELRMAKLEELDTYGITNELTKNKNIIDNTLVKIPARGYDIESALRAMLGEYSEYKLYNTIDELKSAIFKSYPILKNAPIKFLEPNSNSIYKKPYILYDSDEIILYLKDSNINNEEFYNILSTLRSSTNTPLGNLNNEMHRNEYNFLLGFPMYKNENYFTPKISKYRTGNLPYYFTTAELDYSTPLLPFNIVKDIDYHNNERNKLEKYYDDLYSKFKEKIREVSGLSEEDFKHISYADYLKYSDLATLKYPDLAKEDSYYLERENFINNMYDKGRISKYWLDRGVEGGEGAYVYDINKLISNASQEDINNLIRYEILTRRDLINIDNLEPTNYLASSGRIGDTNYYKLNYEYSKYGKNIDNILLKLKEYNIISNSTFDNEPILIYDNFIIPSASLGRYTISIPENKDFFSIYDKFDIDPFGSGNTLSKFVIGKPYEYYTRFYRDKTPNIDDLWLKFNTSNINNYK